MSNIKKYNFDDFSSFCSFVLPNKIKEYLKENTGEEWIYSQNKIYNYPSYDTLNKQDYNFLVNKKKWKNILFKDNYVFFDKINFCNNIDLPITYNFSEQRKEYSFEKIYGDNYLTMEITEASYNLNKSIVYSNNEPENILHKKYDFMPFGHVLSINKTVIDNPNTSEKNVFYFCNFSLVIKNVNDFDDAIKIYCFFMKKDMSKIEKAINDAQINEESYINPNIFPEEAKKTEERIFSIFKNQSYILREKHLPVQLGIMISGLPGTGKSIFVKYLKQKVRPLFNSVYSYGISDLNNLCSHGQDLPNNALLVFDDIECVLKERTQQEDNATILSWLLSQFDNGDRTTNRLIILVTNHTKPIDDALKRPGRIDYHIEFGLPDDKDMEELLSFHTQDDLNSEQISEIVSYMKTKIENATFANVALLCRLVYTDTTKNIKKVEDWKSIIDFMKSSSAYEGKKVKAQEKESRKIGFNS